MKIDNPDLKELLLDYAQRYDEKGERPHELINAEDAAKFEEWLNKEIDNAKDENMDDLIKIRFMFRILLKYADDIRYGESLLLNFFNAQPETL